MEDRRILKSYCWHKGRCFFISTIERDSSAAVSPAPRYMETIAWEYDWDSTERGEMVGMTGDGEAFRQHADMVEQLYRTGEYTEPI